MDRDEILTKIRERREAEVKLVEFPEKHSYFDWMNRIHYEMTGLASTPERRSAILFQTANLILRALEQHGDPADGGQLK